MDTDMPGMMCADDMTALEDAPDAEFQDLWLEMMIEHHTGRRRDGQAETEDGQYKPAIDLADDIVTSQTDEIETMRELLELTPTPPIFFKITRTSQARRTSGGPGRRSFFFSQTTCGAAPGLADHRATGGKPATRASRRRG